MFFKSIYLKGCKSLRVLSNTDAIQIFPTTDLTMVLGTNGGGKTSLLRQITPEGATEKNFIIGGSKIVDITHRGSEYKLTSIVGKTPKHTFVKDGTIIHENVTTSVHNQKVVEEFNFSPVIHKLLIGDLHFTQMTPTDRKEILTLINPLDLTYGLKFHSDLKEQIHDTQAVLKHITIKNADNRTKLNALKVPANINETKEKIEAEISRLLPFSVMEVDSVPGTISAMQKQLQELEKKFDRFDNRRVSSDKITTIEDLNEYVNELSTERLIIQTGIDNLNKEHFALSSIGSDILTQEMTKVEIEEKIYYLTETLANKYKVAIDIHLDGADLDKMQLGYGKIGETLHDIWSWLPAVNYTQEEIAVKRKRNSWINEIVIDKERENRVLQSDLDHYKNPESIMTCPRCNTQFIKSGGDLVTLINHTNITFSANVQLIDGLNKEREALSIELSDILAQEEAVSRISLLKRYTAECMEFWSEFSLATDIIFKRDITANKLHRYISGITYAKEKLELEAELNRYSNHLLVAQSYGAHTVVRTEAIQTEINYKLEKVNELKDELSKCIKLTKYIKHFSDISDQYSELVKALKAKAVEEAEQSVKKYAKTKISEHYNEVAQLLHVWNKYNALLNSITELDDEQAKLSEELKNLRIAEVIISPVKGEIARQMQEFINEYTSRINQIIASTWSYHLAVEPCPIANETLNYIFPLTVMDKNISDISVGSKSQREMINLAFTLVMREYLDLKDYPLYLDELGVGYDEVHRSNYIEFVKGLLNSDDCSQIFFVSHYDSIFGAFANVDTVVLNGDNITVDREVNQIVIFNEEYKNV
jgi:ABC-type molybdenum transport system ATPase subunit/photorepair protein PhrA